MACLTLLLKSDRFNCFVWASCPEGTRSIRQVLPEQSREVSDVDSDIQCCAERSNPFRPSYEKVTCVLLWGAEAVASGRVASRQAGHRVSACWWVSPWAKGRPFWSLPVSVREGGHRHQQLHGMLSTSTPPHLLFTEPGQLMNLHLVSAHHCLSLKSSAVPSKAVFIQGLAGSGWGLSESYPQCTRGGQGNVLVLFFQPGSHHSVWGKRTKAVVLWEPAANFFQTPVMLVAWNWP